MILKSIALCRKAGCHILNGSKLEGIAYVEVCAPSKELIPFLGIRHHEKFIHSLCSKCATIKKRTFCRHKEKSRNIFASLTWPEINFMVLELDYTLVNVFEIYQYAMTHDFFSQFLKLLGHFKMKYGKPSQDETAKMYCKNINTSMKFSDDLVLTPENLTPDKLRRSLFKSDLVSILGKFAQSTYKTECKIVKSQSQLNNIFYDNRSTIQDIFVIGSCCLTVLSPKKCRPKKNSTSNVIIYSYITALGRIFMHQKIIQLQKMRLKVIAIANDCLYFAAPLGIKIPFEFGEGFGCFRNEYEAKKILAFLSFGNRCQIIYYEDQNGTKQSVIKARGFSLKTPDAISQCNFETLKNMMESAKKEIIIIPQFRMFKSLSTMTIAEKLQYFSFTNYVSTNRILMSDLSTLPLGYKK